MAKENEKALLKVCKYYKGEGAKNNPGTQAGRMFYGLERAWVIETLNAVKNDKGSEILDEALALYINAGLADFQETDDVPITLKAFIYCKLSDGPCTPDEFKRVYTEYRK